jgi:predicted molibdopterin-dependent oxidoreductase YjgC
MESDGTFTNCDGRVQRIGRAFSPLEDSREVWRTLLELAAALGHALPYKKPAGIFDGLSQGVPAFEGMSYESLGDSGTQVQGAATTPGTTPGMAVVTP